MESSTFPSPSRNFYSRPCGRGDFVGLQLVNVDHFISTHAPAGGATFAFSEEWDGLTKFLLTPLREGRQKIKAGQHVSNLFLLTPLREGRRAADPEGLRGKGYFYSRPCGRGDCACACAISCWWIFLLTPLREGRLNRAAVRPEGSDFYSRPCGRGDRNCAAGRQGRILFLLTPLREGRPASARISYGTINFYSRPCGRGDQTKENAAAS